MAVNINVKLNADDSSVKKKLSELGKLAKKGLNFGGKDGTPSSSGKPSRASTILEKAMNDLAKAYKKEKQVMEKQGKARYAWEKAKFVGGKVGRFAGAAAEGVHTGASLLTRGTSGQSEYVSGGFMNSVHDKISTVQDTYSKAKEGYSSIKEAYKGQKEEKDEQGNITKPARKGGIAAAALAGLPVVGGVLGSILGGIMKQVDDMGKEWTSVMASQQGTTAATGGYVGGGGGYFQNSEMAQARIAFNRTQSKFGNTNLMGSDKSAVAFAAQQNIGITQYAEQLGQIKEQDSKVSTDFLRGAADINKMTGLKQGQFVQKLASYSSSLKEAGFSRQNMRNFAALTGGIRGKADMTGERAATVGQALDQGVRKGIHGGGAMSMLALSKFSKQNNMSIMDSQEYFEEHGLSDPKVQAAMNSTLGGMGKDVRRFMGKQEFGMTTREAGLLDKITPANIKRGGALTGVTSNRSLEMKNERMSTVVDEVNGVGVAAKGAAELGYKAGQAQLEAFKTLGPAFEPLIEIMGKAEEELFGGIKDLTKEIKGMMDFITKASKEGFGKTIGEEIGKHVKIL